MCYYDKPVAGIKKTGMPYLLPQLTKHSKQNKYKTNLESFYRYGKYIKTVKGKVKFLGNSAKLLRDASFNENLCTAPLDSCLIKQYDSLASF